MQMEGAKPIVILLADDDKDDRDLFGEALGLVDKSVVYECVENGKEVLNKLLELNALPDLIFLDVNMPVLNGWECLAQLKGNKLYDLIPVIIYSTSSHQQEIDRAMTLGATCYLRKPDSFPELKKVLEIITKNLTSNLKEALIEFCGKPSRLVLAAAKQF
jgi:CheY-like chemotaxis protein